MAHRFHIERRKRKEARDMILAMAQHSNHYHGDLSTTQQLESYLAQYGWTLKDLVEECRDKEDSVPFLENLIPSGSIIYAHLD